VFGRRKREEAAAEAAAREAERRALLEKLAQRPDTVCPFLGLERDRAAYTDGVDAAHRCYAFGDPAVLSDEQQTRVCLQRGYGNCPRYLRGVLVIPTEELEALRRPAPPRPEAPPPPPERPRRRFGWAGALVALVLVAGIGAGAAWAFLFGGLDGFGGVAASSPSPTPSVLVTPTPAASSLEPTSSPSAAVSATPSPSEPASSGPATPTPLPTTTAQDVFAFWEVGVTPQTYTLYVVDGGSISDQAQATFADYSHARVEPQQLGDGRVVWVTQNGFYAGYGYIAPDSGSFEIRAVFTSTDGSFHARVLEPDELTVMPEGTPAP
jgi:hypothetical protein